MLFMYGVTKARAFKWLSIFEDKLEFIGMKDN